ncbi:MAG: glycosyltransferase family 87 protein [Isosphaeraceae bacterium]|nr:glycosyltransferase family 87 protein [Isosphaeraceae bacterium]
MSKSPHASAQVPTVRLDRVGRSWGRLERLRSMRLVGGILLLLAMIFSIAPLYNVARGAIFNKDYDLWQVVGKTVLAGGDVYPRTTNLFPFMYPPSCAAMLAPISPLPRGAFVAVLLLINTAAWVACIACSVYLATGRWKGNPPELYFWPSIAIVPFIHDTYLLGQPAILLLALMLGAFVMIRQARPGVSGALVAVAAGIKAFPILAIGWFIYRRQWRATAATVVTLAALMFVLPLAFRSPARVGEDFVLWSRGMLFKYDERTIAQRPHRAYSFKNQSIQATVHRLARPVLANGEDDKTWRVNLISLDFKTTTLLMLGATGSLGLFYLWSSRRARLVPPNDAVEASMITLMILMVAPLSFNYSYAWLMYPFTLLAHLGFVSPAGSKARRTALFAIAASVGLLILTIPFPKHAQAYGNVFFSGLILFVVLGRVLERNWYRWSDDAENAGIAKPHGMRAATGADWVGEGAGI